MFQKGLDLMNKRRIALILCFALTLSMLVKPELSEAKKAKPRLNKKKGPFMLEKVSGSRSREQRKRRSGRAAIKK